MKQLIKADALTLVLAGLLVVATIWWVVEQLAGAKNQLAYGVFFFALGLLLGNEFRLLRVPPGRES